MPRGFMLPEEYGLVLSLEEEHFGVKRPYPTTFEASADMDFSVLHDTSCLLMHAEVHSI